MASSEHFGGLEPAPTTMYNHQQSQLVDPTWDWKQQLIVPNGTDFCSLIDNPPELSSPLSYSSPGRGSVSTSSSFSLETPPPPVTDMMRINSAHHHTNNAYLPVPVPQQNQNGNSLYWGGPLPGLGPQGFATSSHHGLQDFHMSPPWTDPFVPTQQQSHLPAFSPFEGSFNASNNIRTGPFDTYSEAMAPGSCSLADAAAGYEPRIFYGTRPPVLTSSGNRSSRRVRHHHQPRNTGFTSPESMNADDLKANKHPCTYADCPASFARQEHLKRHVQSVHTAKRTYSCPVHMVLGDAYCDQKKVPNRKAGERGSGVKNFPERIDNLNQHIRTHIWREHARNATLKVEAVRRCIDLCGSDESIKKKLHTSLNNRLKSLREHHAPWLPFGKPKPIPHWLFPPEDFIYEDGHPIGIRWTEGGFQSGTERVCGCPVARLEHNDHHDRHSRKSYYSSSRL